MPHEPRLTHSLRQLLHTRRTAALGTLQPPATAGAPALPSVSFVPYAMDAQQSMFVLHLSGLAAHTRQLQAQPLGSLLITAAEREDEPVHALERVSVQVHAQTPERGSDGWCSAMAAYIQRFPEAAFMAELGDFRLVLLQPLHGRHVAGFGAARDVDVQELQLLLRGPESTAE